LPRFVSFARALILIQITTGHTRKLNLEAVLIL
jgi:hypothetical protein